ncbi:3-oxoacyl-ACP synthase III family protein [Chitinibacter sp. ZOR0017]|uniref:3-oxoacyl-ACP synthase III family protein n=1 Tax=Chitinibacter sp. ZOR0017 TaxID=1339254 RepID=UPI000645DF5F|nr:ketoacyl-ACP synthase III [Chitinibacter sp. ZOR0017]
MQRKTRILDMASYLPEFELNNDELARIYPDWTADKIYLKTGIKSRRIASESETAVDLAFNAASALFENGLVNRRDIDFIILCTQTPDYFLPTSACILQDRLGIPTSAGALDVNLGCSGYVYGLSLAHGLISSGSAKCVLLLTADTYTKLIHPHDKSVRTLFGDAAVATVLVESSAQDQSSIGSFVFGTDGSGANDLKVDAGGFRNLHADTDQKEVVDDSGNIRTSSNLQMNGAAIMAFSLTVVPKAFNLILDKSGLNRDDFDFFVFHQANKFMLDSLRKKLKIPEDKFPILMESCGNTVSSSIPMALLEMRKSGQLVRGKRVMLLGFGVGLSWAGCVLNF